MQLYLMKQKVIYTVKQCKKIVTKFSYFNVFKKYEFQKKFMILIEYYQYFKYFNRLA